MGSFMYMIAIVVFFAGGCAGIYLTRENETTLAVTAFVGALLVGLTWLALGWMISLLEELKERIGEAKRDSMTKAQ